MIKKLLITLSLIILFSLPSVIWCKNTGDLSIYFSSSAPEGQWFYVLSKLAGMYTLMCIAWQIIATLLTRLDILQLRWLGVMHGIFGSLIIILAMSHATLFFLAMSQRQGYPAWTLLVPDFSSYYHTYLSFGLLGLVTLLAVFVTGLLRLRQTPFVKKLHSLYWLSIGFAYIHALSIGTETQTNAGLALYISLGLIAVILWLIFVIKQLKTRVIFQ
jgi:hypothetical protein